MKTKQKREYRRLAMRVVELQHRTMLLQMSDPKPVRGGNSINDWGNGGTTNEDIYM